METAAASRIRKHNFKSIGMYTNDTSSSFIRHFNVDFSSFMQLAAIPEPHWPKQARDTPLCACSSRGHQVPSAYGRPTGSIAETSAASAQQHPVLVVKLASAALLISPLLCVESSFHRQTIIIIANSIHLFLRGELRTT